MAKSSKQKCETNGIVHYMKLCVHRTDTRRNMQLRVGPDGRKDSKCSILTQNDDADGDLERRLPFVNEAPKSKKAKKQLQLHCCKRERKPQKCKKNGIGHWTTAPKSSIPIWDVTKP